MSIRILLVDDHKIVRDGLRSLIEKDQDTEVVGEASDGRAAVQQVRNLSPDVVIMDIAMPDLNGIEATRQILAERPGIKVVALSMHSDSRFIAEMLRSGALGYLLKNCAFEELTKAIHSVTDQLIAEAMGLSAVIGEPIVGTFLSGGGTDGSLTQAKGLPTVDSLGLNGGGAHSSREWTTIKSLVARTQLFAVLLDRIVSQEKYVRGRP